MSIKLRLNLALALVLALALMSVMAALLIDAGPRLRDEIASSMRVTEGVVRASLATVEQSPYPDDALAALISGLRNQRHVRVTLASRMPERGNILPAERHPGAVLPAWLAEEHEPVVRIPVEANGRNLGTLLIAAEGSDEMREVWETIGSIMIYGGLFALGAFLVTSYLIGTALAPIGQLDAAMKHLEEGDYDVELTRRGPPEIAGIFDRVNTLACALRATRHDNQRLSTAIVRIQDEERRDLARELHDELGPHLFSLRANGAALIGQIDKGTVDLDRIRRDVGGMMEQADALQQTNRRVLQRLSPAGLKELGLARALAALVGMWRKELPATEVRLDIAGEVDGLDETVTLTIYRVVQEGLTNAFRHAGAARIAVDVTRIQPGPKGEEGAAAAGAVLISICDDGEGMPEETSGGFGLQGMRERIGALGGSLRIAAGEPKGTIVEALVPLGGA